MKTKTESTKQFICYYENKCSHNDCEYQEPHYYKREPGYYNLIFSKKGIDYYVAKCPYSYYNKTCYEVFGIHMIREYYKDRYFKSGETRIKNLEKKIEKLREEISKAYKRINND